MAGRTRPGSTGGTGTSPEMVPLSNWNNSQADAWDSKYGGLVSQIANFAGNDIENPFTRTPAPTAHAAPSAGAPRQSTAQAGSEKPVAAAPNPNTDLTTPGWGEQYWATNGADFAGQDHLQQASDDLGGLFKEPTASEQYWGQVGGTKAENRSDAEYDAFDSSGPDFGAYYDHAYTRGANKLNKEQAARGQYGSSTGSQALADFGSGLEADRANRESDFMAQRQRDRIGAAGQADQVDLSNLLGRSQIADSATRGAMGRAQGGISLAGLLDDNERADFSTGMTAATNAQGLKEGRVRGSFADMMSLAAPASATAAGGLDNLFTADQDAMMTQIAMQLGVPREKLNQILATQNSNREGLGSIFSMVGSMYGMNGMGGGGGGQSAPAAAPAAPEDSYGKGYA